MLVGATRIAVPLFVLLACVERPMTRRWVWYREKTARLHPHVRRALFAGSGSVVLSLLIVLLLGGVAA